MGNSALGVAVGVAGRGHGGGGGGGRSGGGSIVVVVAAAVAVVVMVGWGRERIDTGGCVVAGGPARAVDARRGALEGQNVGVIKIRVVLETVDG